MQVVAGRAEELERTRPFGLLAEAFGCASTSPDPRRAAISALLATHGRSNQGPITVTSDPGLQFRTVDALLQSARDERSAALVLRGEPGIGKSALLAYAIERAVDMERLRAAGVEAEAQLPFAGLQALLLSKLDLLDIIPAPQARALRAALALSPPEDDSRLAAYAGTPAGEIPSAHAASARARKNELSAAVTT